MTNEWKIRDHELRFDEENQIMRLRINGQFTSSDNDEEFGILREFYSEKDIKRLTLVDLTNAEAASGEERKKLKKSIEASDDFIERSALIGASPAVRMVAKILIKFSGGKGKISFFKNEEEAISWLKED